MIIQKAYKFRLKLRSRQEIKLRRAAGCCRLVWNKMLALQKARLDWNEPLLGYADLCSVLPVWKEQLPFLNDPPSQTLQQVAKDLSRAFTNFFDPQLTHAFPTFKRKGEDAGLRFPQGFAWDRAKHQVHLPKIGRLRYRNSYEQGQLLGEASQIHLTQEGKHWDVSIQVEYEVPDPIHPSSSMEGMDMGVVNFAVLSDGTIIKPLNSFRTHELKLAREQHKLSRKQKFSKNHAVLFLEALRILNMTASAAGTPEEPGRNVKAKAGLNKSILDQGWAEFRRQLTYKEKWHGGLVISVPPHHTSQECPLCDHTEEANRRTRDTFCCQKCSFTAPADLVGAINIKRRGTSLLPVEDPQGPTKQEPFPSRGLPQRKTS